MAFAEVGLGTQRATDDASAVASLALAYPGNVTSGNLLWAGGACYRSDGDPQPIVVTSTRVTGNWTIIHQTVSADTANFIAYAVAESTGACTVTVNPAGGATADISFSIDEFSGQHATPLSVDGGGSSGTNSDPADSITTATANELVTGVASWFFGGGATTITPASGYTEIGEFEDLNFQVHAAEFQIVTTAQAYSVGWTFSDNTRDWHAMTASFKIAASGTTLALSGSAGTSGHGTSVPNFQVAL
jgi:hypothetical protein